MLGMLPGKEERCEEKETDTQRRDRARWVGACEQQKSPSNMQPGFANQLRCFPPTHGVYADPPRPADPAAAATTAVAGTGVGLMAGGATAYPKTLARLGVRRTAG